MTLDKTITSFGQISGLDETFINEGYFYFGIYCEFNKIEPKILKKLDYDKHYGDITFEVRKSFGQIMSFFKFD